MDARVHAYLAMRSSRRAVFAEEWYVWMCTHHIPINLIADLGVLVRVGKIHGQHINQSDGAHFYLKIDKPFAPSIQSQWMIIS